MSKNTSTDNNNKEESQAAATTHKHRTSMLLSLLLGGAILYWMYRDFDFSLLQQVMRNGMNWWWMLLSFPFGILAQALRGWRWRMALEPLGEKPRLSTAVNAVFLSYAASLLIPRIGEFARCGVLKRYDDVSFSKALGTVVTERAIDSLVVLAVTTLTLLGYMHVFGVFFQRTGTSVESILAGFSLTGYAVSGICLAAMAVLVWFLLRQLSLHDKVKATFSGIWQGVKSVAKVKRPWLFILMTLGIWLSYFLHYYLTFFCFASTASLGLDVALVTFIVGSIAVIVPTPNGAGPWHFAVKTMLILYGVADTEALYFVLIVHSVQTLLVAALGFYAWLALAYKTKKITLK